jgi:hypothetical protein
MTPSGTNPTQVTAYVVSGVGFLGAGVIISDGLSVRGINTAATDQRWVLLYVERWLKAPLQREDGSLVERDRGTPQGSK